jgi:ABC-type sugar transport system permease subunit
VSFAYDPERVTVFIVSVGRPPAFSRRACAFRSSSPCVALAFLGLFFLYPLSRIFNASILDPSGVNFTVRNYVRILGSPFYQAAS